MDGIVLEESKKRRLPQWMLGVSTADQVKNTRKGDSNDVNKIEKEETATICIKKKTRGRRMSAKCDDEVDAHCEDVLDEEQSNLVVKRERVTRKKKAVRKDVASKSDDSEETVIEKKSKQYVGRIAVQKSVSRRIEKRESKGFESSEDIKAESKEFESGEDIEAASPNEDDEDLTMDDLISIANEFVKDEKDRGQQKESDAEQIKKTRKWDSNNVNKIEKEETAPICTTKMSRGRRSAQCDDEVDAPFEDVLDEEQSNLVVKRQRVTRKKNAVRKDVAIKSNDAEEAVIEEKNKQNVGRRAVQKSVSRRREKRESKGFESSEDIEAASPSEDDEDLTMNDLISIANEFVKDEKDRGQQKKSGAEQIIHKQCAPTDISRNEPADSVVTSETVKRLPVHEETASCHNLSCTGDPAQDMLDLLLGPLLTQLPKEEKKADIITDAMIFAHQLRKQNQKVDIRDAAIPLAKKKTSLKDKVAMLLD